MSEAPICVVENIVKRYDGLTAVDGVSFEAQPGQILGLLGPNGAGKTTTIRIILNILQADAGRVTVLGERVSDKTKERIGYLPEERGLFKKMKLREQMIFFGRLHGKSAHDAGHAADEWLTRLDLTDRAAMEVGKLSKGLQQKAQFGCTVLHNPALLILDEVFSGLDPVNVKKVRDILGQLRDAGTAIIFSTHILEQAEALCDAVVMLKGGKAHIAGRTHEVKRRFGKDWFNVATEDEAHFDLVAQHPMVAAADRHATSVAVSLKPDADSNDFLRALLDAGARVVRFERTTPTLTQIFLEQIGGLTPEVSEAEARIADAQGE